MWTCTTSSSGSDALIGAPKAIGHGNARAVVRTDIAGKPIAIALVLSASALDGLPLKDRAGGWSYVVAMPGGVQTGFDHISVDWNPQGHPPPGVYAVPHFDFHFYTIGRAQQMAVTFPQGPKDPAGRVDPALIPPGYTVVPEFAVPAMGTHGVDLSGPDFRGKFTTTFLYGYYKDKLIFVEPMITRKFLKSHPNVTMPVPTPAKYSTPGYYPTKYSVRYDVAQNAYVIELGALRAYGT